MTNTPQGHEFYTWIYTFARLVTQRNEADPWLARLMAAICCLETGWGSSIPTDHETGAGSHNYCGYMWRAGKGWPYVTAREAMTKQLKRFRVFATPTDCMVSLYYLLAQSSHHVAARETYCQTIASARVNYLEDLGLTYCESDTKWAEKIEKILEMQFAGGILQPEQPPPRPSAVEAAKK